MTPESVSHRGILLQLALDMTDLAAALRVAAAAAPHVDRVEVGTPLLMAAGLSAVRALRQLLPAAVLVADTKICDAGERMAAAAFAAGADMVTVVAAAADAVTWAGILQAARRLPPRPATGCVMADLIGCADLFKAAQAAWTLGADYLCVHLPKQDSHSGASPLWQGALAQAARVARDVPVPVYLAGGLRPQDMPQVLETGARGVIVGGAIAGAADPGAMARSFRVDHPRAGGS